MSESEIRVVVGWPRGWQRQASAAMEQSPPGALLAPQQPQRTPFGDPPYNPSFL